MFPEFPSRPRLAATVALGTAALSLSTLGVAAPAHALDATATDSPSATATETATPTESASATPSDSATPTDSATATPSDTASATPSETASATPSDTASATPTDTASATPTAPVRPAITSTATDAADHDNALAWTGGTVVDTVNYTGLVPGRTYVVVAQLVADVNGRPVPTGILGRTVFVPTSADGSANVTFRVGSQFAGKKLVAFEALVQGRTVVAAHQDVNDAAATVAVDAAPSKTVTFRVARDTWKLSNRTAAATATKVVADHLYTYREDMVWNRHTGKVLAAPLTSGASTQMQTLSVTVPANATPAQVLAAEQAVAARTNQVNAGRPAVGRVGATMTTAWIVPAGAWDTTTTWTRGLRAGAQVLAGSVVR